VSVTVSERRLAKSYPTDKTDLWIKTAPHFLIGQIDPVVLIVVFERRSWRSFGCMGQDEKEKPPKTKDHRQKRFVGSYVA
jgi:hypothetical protein